MAARMKSTSYQRHIGLLFSNFGGGGIQRVRLTLAEALLQKGWRVDLIVVNSSGPLKSEIPAGSQLFDLSVAHSSQSIQKIITYLHTENPDILLSSQTHINISAIIARSFSHWKGRLFLTEHITIDYVAKNATNWKDRLLPFLARLFYRGADGVILVSKQTAQHFIKATHLPERLVHVIYNPIVSHRMIDQSKLQADHKWFDLRGTPVVLSAGRLTKQKDFDTLLKAFRLVVLNIPSARLLILGEGEELDRLLGLVDQLNLKESVQFMGYVNNPYAFMEKAAAFVLSSQWEGFGNVLAEAMACGTPVVSTDCPSGPREILDNGTYGALVPPGNPEMLAAAILDEIRNPHNKDLLKQRANEFSIEKILPQYIQLLTGDREAGL